MNSKIESLKQIGYAEDDALIFVRANGQCEYCDVDLIGNRLAWDSAQFDHIIPKSKDGSDKPENLALACRVCNTAKAGFIPEGDTREDRIGSTRVHLQYRRSHANEFWEQVKSIMR